MHGTQDGTVTQLTAQGRDGTDKIRFRYIPQDGFAKGCGNLAHFTGDSGIIAGQFCMVSAGVDDAQGMLTGMHVIADALHLRFCFILEINCHNAAHGGCHLIHQTAGLAEVNIFRILSDFGDINGIQFAAAEETVNHDTNDGFICRRRGQTGAAEYVAGHIGIKAFDFKAALMGCCRNTTDQGGGTVGFLRMGRQVGQIHLICRIAFRLDTDDHAVIGCCTGDNIQIDTGRQHIAALVVGMVAAQLGSSRCTEQFDFIRASESGTIAVDDMQQTAAVRVYRLRAAAIHAADGSIHAAGS